MRTAAATTPTDPRFHGFHSLGEFAQSVKMAAGTSRHHPPDERLLLGMGPTTPSSEGVGEAGGYAVPPGWSGAIAQAILSQASLLGRTTTLPLARGNELHFGADEIAPWNANVAARWQNELDQLAQQKFSKLEGRTLRLKKVTALLPVSSELVEDSAALDGYLRLLAPGRIDYAISAAILGGDGLSRPLGVWNSGAMIVVPKSGGQAAGTVTLANVQAMLNALYAAARPNAIWVANPDVEPQLQALGFPYWIPAGLSGGAFGTLLGVPLLLHEAALPLGQQGDITLLDPTSFITIRRAREDLSMHLFFDYDVFAYRFVVRIDGMPLWRAPVARPNSASSCSTIVALAAR